MSLAFDENGNSFIILKEQTHKERITGVDALKRHIFAARTIADIMRTSLGPRGMDKMLVSPDGDVTVTNDGATIMDKLDLQDRIARLLVQMSKSQDDEVGDGTTSVVVLAGALLEQAQILLEKGVNPLKIAKGFEDAANVTIEHLDSIARNVDVSDESGKEYLRKTVATTLSSKVVNTDKEHLASIAVDAVLAVADLERKDVNLDLIKITKNTGGVISESQLVRGIVIDKDFSHMQMRKEIKDAKICILTTPFEPFKMKTKDEVIVRNVEQYKKLAEIEQDYFKQMIKYIKDAGANVVMCQWGFDDEANHLLLANDIPAIRWVGGVEIELLAIATGARIIPRFEDITPEKLGRAGVVREISFGTNSSKAVIVEDCSNTKAVTIVLRGSNHMLVEEVKRSLQDALSVVRSIIKDSRVVLGGGASEISCSLALSKKAQEETGIKQLALNAFSDALEAIPSALAENSGYSGISTLSTLKAIQDAENTAKFGVDCLYNGTNDMEELNVVEPLISKRNQILLATQVVKMILKIDDVIKQGEI